MNRKQRCALIASAVIIALMLLFPPFHWPRGLGGPVDNRGYGFLFDVPDGGPTVNIGTLLVQWLGVILVAGILWFAFQDKNKGS